MSELHATPIAATVQPGNPAMVALQILAGVGLVAGAIMIAVGSGQVTESYGAAAGLPVIIWGGVALNVGLLALFGALTAAAARWRP